jgi:ectoine hydroxylase-related dioxygenase (phytanoyl-CoA dioxygenase family)
VPRHPSAGSPGSTVLPRLTSAFALPSGAAASFSENGHVHIPGLASAEEVGAYRPRIADCVERYAFDKRPIEERDTYGKAFLQTFNLWQRDEVVASFTRSPRFAAAAAALLGVERVRLYHDQALYKEAGGGHTPWHQDQYYWPLDTDKTITMWMPLVDVTPESGPMVFGDGTHRLGHLGAHAISDESDAVFDQAVAERGISLTTYGHVAAGDATFHSGWTLHRAGANHTDQVREVMTVIYFADGTTVGPLDSPARRFDQKIWLPGCELGGPAASPINPVL